LGAATRGVAVRSIDGGTHENIHGQDCGSPGRGDEDVLVTENIDDIQAALEQFCEIAEDLSEEKPYSRLAWR
jgi:hypothetical protein